VPLSCNLGTLTSWNPLGHTRPITGLFLLVVVVVVVVVVAVLVVVATAAVAERKVFRKMSRRHKGVLEVQLYSCLNPGAVEGRVVNATLRPLKPQERNLLRILQKISLALGPL